MKIEARGKERGAGGEERQGAKRREQEERRRRNIMCNLFCRHGDPSGRLKI